jgi:hypothetical protein
METIDKITQRIRRLPERSQKEVLHFIEFLLSKAGKIEEGIDTQTWSKFSLDQAMRGIENDDMPNYYESDLKEKHSQ